MPEAMSIVSGVGTSNCNGDRSSSSTKSKIPRSVTYLTKTKTEEKIEYLVEQSEPGVKASTSLQEVSTCKWNQRSNCSNHIRTSMDDSFQVDSKCKKVGKKAKSDHSLHSNQNKALGRSKASYEYPSGATDFEIKSKNEKRERSSSAGISRTPARVADNQKGTENKGSKPNVRPRSANDSKTRKNSVAVSRNDPQNANVKNGCTALHKSVTFLSKKELAVKWDEGVNGQDKKVPAHEPKTGISKSKSPCSGSRHPPRREGTENKKLTTIKQPSQTQSAPKKTEETSPILCQSFQGFGKTVVVRLRDLLPKKQQRLTTPFENLLDDLEKQQNHSEFYFNNDQNNNERKMTPNLIKQRRHWEVIRESSDESFAHEQFSSDKGEEKGYDIDDSEYNSYLQYDPLPCVSQMKGCPVPRLEIPSSESDINEEVKQEKRKNDSGKRKDSGHKMDSDKEKYDPIKNYHSPVHVSKRMARCTAGDDTLFSITKSTTLAVGLNKDKTEILNCETEKSLMCSKCTLQKKETKEPKLSSVISMHSALKSHLKDLRYLIRCMKNIGYYTTGLEPMTDSLVNIRNWMSEARITKNGGIEKIRGPEATSLLAKSIGRLADEITSQQGQEGEQQNMAEAEQHPRGSPNFLGLDIGVQVSLTKPTDINSPVVDRISTDAATQVDTVCFCDAAVQMDREDFLKHCLCDISTPPTTRAFISQLLNRYNMPPKDPSADAEGWILKGHSDVWIHQQKPTEGRVEARASSSLEDTKKERVDWWKRAPLCNGISALDEKCVGHCASIGDLTDKGKSPQADARLPPHPVLRNRNHVKIMAKTVTTTQKDVRPRPGHASVLQDNRIL